MNIRGYSKAIAPAAMLVALGTLGAGCGGTHQATEKRTVSPTASPPPTASPSPAGNKVGDTVTVTYRDMKYDVTLMKVVEPAQPASEYGSAQAGHHLAGVQFRITAASVVDENSNLNATVIIQHDARDVGKLPAFPAAAK